jgi:hypothetical protein
MDEEEMGSSAATMLLGLSTKKSNIGHTRKDLDLHPWYGVSLLIHRPLRCTHARLSLPQ